MKSISCYLERLVKPAVEKRGFYQVKIITDWPLIAGSKLSKLSIPKKISSYKSSDSTYNILHIEVDNNSIATEFYYQEPAIIEKISLYFGYKAVSKLKIVIQNNAKGDLPEKYKPKIVSLTEDEKNMLNEMTNNIEDIYLKKAFYLLGSYIIK